VRRFYAALFLVLAASIHIQAQNWQTRFGPPAFLIEKPTALYAAPGDLPLQTLRPSSSPFVLQSATAVETDNGSLYHPTSTGEFILSRTPTAGGLSEDKGRLVYLPQTDLQAFTGADPSRAWEQPDTLGASLLLAANTAVRPLYISTRPYAMVWIEHDYGHAWIPYPSLAWRRGADATPAPPPQPPSFRRQAALDLIAAYNLGVKRSRTYYHQTTGHTVEARTLSLLDFDENTTTLELRLGVQDGHIQLEAEAMLEKLLRQKLGHVLKIEWP
jgi:hypothetical protein